MHKYKPVVLVVLDGWGEWDTKMGNPVTCARLPTIDKFNKWYPKMLLEASGLSVGLPWGIFGNSEVGHQTMGSGQIIYHYLPTITAAIQSRRFFENKALLEAINWVKKHKSRLHLIGLVSSGGVHSHIDHIYALLKLAREQEINNVFIHALTDGRDTPQKEGINFIGQLETNIKKIGCGAIASVTGRYFTMDRNRNWDRVEKGLAACIDGKGIKDSDPHVAIQKQYDEAKSKGDEYLEPIVIVNEKKEPLGQIRENDAIINFNFRSDRARQMSYALTQNNFDKFANLRIPGNLKYVGFTKYAEDIEAPVVFLPQKITTRLGQILSSRHKSQLRIAETEKFAHVTYFFNGGLSEPFKGEDRIFVPSKNARSYAEIPEMSIREVNEKLFKAIESDKYDFVLVNYANPDMVGHTGDFKAGIKALEVVDECLGKLTDLVLSKNGCLLVTADHGNIEEMVNLETGQIDTQHSTNPVPFWFVSTKSKLKEPPEGAVKEIKGMIADIAATVLDLFNIKSPRGMIGESLINRLGREDKEKE